MIHGAGPGPCRAATRNAKAKLKKPARRSRTHEPLAYKGNNHKTDEFAPIFYGTSLASTNRTSSATVS